MSTDVGLKRLLILDDDADFRKLVMIYLKKMFEGVELVEYDPVAQGAPSEDFDWSKYDVLLLDYYLCIHGVTGLDILQANRKNKFFPATIMLTGAGNEEVAVRAIKAGVYEYLRKEKLDKQELRNSILDAFEKHKTERERLSELTNQSRAFNKALFYEQLERAGDEDQKKRVLLLLELDNHEVLEERLGMILRDNIVKHIAKQSFEVFQLGECDPNITRFSDVSVALLIDDPGSEKTLTFNLEGLCKHLEKRPYRFEDKKFRFTVSIGVVTLATHQGTAEEIIQQVRNAREMASQSEGNTFHILTEALVEQEPESPAPEPAAVVEETPVEEIAKPAEPEPPAPPPTPEPTAVVEEAPAEETAPVETAQPAEPEPPAPPPTPEPTAVVEEAPAEETAPVETAQPAEPEPPAPPPTPEPTAVVEEAPAEEAAPVETAQPAEPEPPKPEPVAPAPAPAVAAKKAPAEKPAAVETTKPTPATPPPAPAPKVEAKEAPAEKPAAVETTKPKPAAPPPAPAPKVEAKEAPAEKPAAVETTKPKPAAPPPAPAAKPKAPKKDEAELIEAELDEAALKIKKAFDEKRVIQTFQPIISLSDTGEDEEHEVHSISLQLLDTDGKIIDADEIYEQTNTPAFRKYIDRWMIREAIGRVVNSEMQYTFVIKLSQESLADATLFNWLRKLLGGFDESNPGKSIALEISAPDFSTKEKQAGALIAYLTKSHGFRFTLSEFADQSDVNPLTSKAGFALVRVDHELAKQLAEEYEDESKTSLLQELKALGVNVIADNVEDATTLTEVISVGVDYALGNFIGEPTQQLDEITNVESFEIV